MAKPTKFAPHICTACTILALLGIVLGLWQSLPLIIVIFLLPTAIYEAYRTEGKSTKAASILLVTVLVAEIFLVLFNVDFNLAKFLETDQQYIGGYLVPLGDIRVVGPTVMAVLSVILFVRTHGVYTRWLAVVVLITSLAIVYTLDPVIFQDLLRLALGEGLKRVY
ncbi:MAG: hypothetical protein PHR64_00060 [Candidatus Shapirobacteria bacterium]|nr:hypothetical protein [Candidatus Shapirobacteria bacterium]MDD5073579.1 hypothetical protein [Candidatus Shapirobacteria bacterium]MDD5481332.1 hypothetical protein [Candidatus Shapirobacteria bacterium]